MVKMISNLKSLIILFVIRDLISISCLWKFNYLLETFIIILKSSKGISHASLSINYRQIDGQNSSSMGFNYSFLNNEISFILLTIFRAKISMDCNLRFRNEKKNIKLKTTLSTKVFLSKLLLDVNIALYNLTITKHLIIYKY